MKKLLIIICLLSGIAASAQVDTTKQRQLINAYGYAYKNTAIDSSLRIPRDTFKLRRSDSGSIAYKSGQAWLWNGTTWVLGSGSGGGVGSVASPITLTGSTVGISYRTDGLQVEGASLAAKSKILKSFSEMRAVLPDTGVVYYLKRGSNLFPYYYDPADASSTDDSATVFVSSGSRFKAILDDVVYPEMWGAKGDGTTDDAAAFNRMMVFIGTASNSYQIKFKHRVYLINSPVIFPSTVAATYELNAVLMEGYGVTIKTTAAISIFFRQPTNVTLMNTQVGNYHMVIKGINFVGTLTTGQKAIEIGCQYGAQFDQLTFTNFDTAVVARFWLKGSITNCFFKVKSVGVLGSHYNGMFTGATINNSSFNINSIEKCRFFMAAGSFTSIKLEGADQITVRDVVSEGFVPRYNFHFDYGGSTNSNSSTFENIWIETTQSGVHNTLFYLRYGGTMTLKGVQREQADTLFELGSVGANSSLVIERFPFLGALPAKAFNAQSSLLSGASITVKDMPYATIQYFLDTAYWVGGVLPFNVSTDGQLASNSGYSLRQSGSLFLEPNVNNGAGGRTVYVKAGLHFPNDNTNYIGGIGGNERPVRISAGTGGIRVDAGAAFGFGFGTNLANPAEFMSRLRTGVINISSAGATRLAVGTTAQRTIAGDLGIRYNSDTSFFEASDGANWKRLATAQAVRDTAAQIRAAIAAGAGFVPYTGATTDVNIGSFSLQGNTIKAWGDNSTTGGSLSFKQFATVGSTGIGTTSIFALGANQIYFSHGIASGNTKQAVFDVSTIPANATNTYTLPPASGQLATTADIISASGQTEITAFPVNADYTIASATAPITVIYYSTMTADRTVTLPAATVDLNRVITITNAGAGGKNVMLSPVVYQNDAVTFSGIAPGGSVQLVSIGTKWVIRSKY